VSGSLQLVPVTAFYIDAAGDLVAANPLNALAASDWAPKWERARQIATQEQGWELLISPPSSGDYTRAFFRTPDDQNYLDNAGAATAASVDGSAHQAGRAVDLDLVGMQDSYSNYDYNTLVGIMKRAGLYNRVYQANGTEPWHFDDNPASIFGSTKAAIQAIGNLSSQVAQDLALGLPTPQQLGASIAAAVQAAAKNPVPSGVGVLLLAGGAWALFNSGGERARRRAKT